MTTDKVGRAPLYVRALRLRNLHVSGFGSFVLFECMIAIGVLLALAELVTWWAVLVLPVAVALMVKINDVAMSGSRARRAAGARERTGLDGVRAEQSRAAYRSLDDADRAEPGRGGYRELDDVELGHAAAHRSYDDADRDREPITVQRHTAAVIDRDDLDEAGEARQATNRHATERARAAGRGERAGVGAGQRADGEFAVAGQRTAEQSDQAGQQASAVAGEVSTSRTVPAAGSVVGGQRSNSGTGTPQSEEARRPVGVIRISIPPRDGATRGSGARTTTTAQVQTAAAAHTEDAAGAVRSAARASEPTGRIGELPAGAQVGTDAVADNVYGEDTGVVPGTGIWLNRPGTRRTDGPRPSQHGDGDAFDLGGQGAVHGGGYGTATGTTTYGGPPNEQSPSVHRGQGAVYGRGGHGYDASDGDTVRGGTSRNGGGYGATYGTGVYGSAASGGRYATGDDSDADYGYATDSATTYGPSTSTGYEYQTDSTDAYGNGARQPGRTSGEHTTGGSTGTGCSTGGSSGTAHAGGGGDHNDGHSHDDIHNDGNGDRDSNLDNHSGGRRDANSGGGRDSRGGNEGRGGRGGPDSGGGNGGRDSGGGNGSRDSGGGNGSRDSGGGNGSRDSGGGNGSRDSGGGNEGRDADSGGHRDGGSGRDNADRDKADRDSGGDGYGYGQQAGRGYQQTGGQGYGGGHGLDDSLWSGGSGQERRSWVGGPAGYDPDPGADSFNTGYARAAYGDDVQPGDQGRHSRGRHTDEDRTSGRHTDRGWRTEDDLTRSRTTTNQGRFA